MKKNEYKCEACGKIYTKGWSDKKMEEEAKRLWSPILLKDTVIICDDCFKRGIVKFN
jgi:DNA-directed RNA polymerase subunit RPC12/RpoP